MTNNVYLSETDHWMHFLLWRRWIKTQKHRWDEKVQFGNGYFIYLDFMCSLLRCQNWAHSYPSRWDSRASFFVCRTMYLKKDGHIWHNPYRDMVIISVQHHARVMKGHLLKDRQTEVITYRILSSDPNSPFIDGSGSVRDEDGGGSRILSSVSTSSAWEGCWYAPVTLFMWTFVWFCWTVLGPGFGVSLWLESGVSAPSPLSIQLDSEEERSRYFLYGMRGKVSREITKSHRL